MEFHTININGLKMFYRESGAKSLPTILLLHGFPTSSAMFRNLIPFLENNFHLIAPDYIGFGQSASPDHQKFSYTFVHLTDYVDAFIQRLHINQFYMYVFDYGAPIGFNLALRYPNESWGLSVKMATSTRKAWVPSGQEESSIGNTRPVNCGKSTRQLFHQQRSKSSI